MSSEEEIDELSDEEIDPTSNGAYIFEDFTITGSLQKPRQLSYSTNELRHQIKDNSIDLNPEYQRGVVWSLPKQVALIDSIFKHYFVPPVILAEIQRDGAEVMVCIDGKQRLTAIKAFLDGEIYYHDTETKSKVYYTDNGVGKSKKKLLPEKYRGIFAQRNLVCIVYTGLVDEQIRDMFQRVQQGMTLNTAERMQAIAGPKTDFIKELDQSYFIHGSHLGEKLKLNENRSATFHNLAQFMWIFAQFPERRSAPTRSELHHWLEDQDEPNENLAKNTADTLKYFTKIAKDERYIQHFRRQQAYAPVEFIFTALLIVLHKGSLSKEEISRGIGLMRREVRLKFPGQIRTNKPCCTLLWAFVEDVTVTTMNAKEKELELLEKFKANEGRRQREDNKKAKTIEVSDEEMDVDLSPPPRAASPRKRKRVGSPAKQKIDRSPSVNL